MSTPVSITQESTYLNVDAYNSDPYNSRPCQGTIRMSTNLLQDPNKKYSLNLIRAQLPLFIPIKNKNEDFSQACIRRKSDSYTITDDPRDSINPNLTEPDGSIYTFNEWIDAVNACYVTMFYKMGNVDKVSYPFCRIVNDKVEFLIPKYASFNATQLNYLNDYEFFGNFDMYSQIFSGHRTFYDRNASNSYKQYKLILDIRKSDVVMLPTGLEYYRFVPETSSLSNFYTYDTVLFQCNLPQVREVTGAFDDNGDATSIEVLSDFNLMQVDVGTNVVILPNRERLINLFPTPTNDIRLSVSVRSKSGFIRPLMLRPHTHFSAKLELRTV